MTERERLEDIKYRYNYDSFKKDDAIPDDEVSADVHWLIARVEELEASEVKCPVCGMYMKLRKALGTEDGRDKEIAELKNYRDRVYEWALACPVEIIDVLGTVSIEPTEKDKEIAELEEALKVCLNFLMHYDATISRATTSHRDIVNKYRPKALEGK